MLVCRGMPSYLDRLLHQALGAGSMANLVPLARLLFSELSVGNCYVYGEL